jgi:hypothetical protein
LDVFKSVHSFTGKFCSKIEYKNLAEKKQRFVKWTPGVQLPEEGHDRIGGQVGPVEDPAAEDGDERNFECLDLAALHM